MSSRGRWPTRAIAPCSGGCRAARTPLRFDCPVFGVGQAKPSPRFHRGRSWPWTYLERHKDGPASSGRLVRREIRLGQDAGLCLTGVVFGQDRARPGFMGRSSTGHAPPARACAGSPAPALSAQRGNFRHAQAGRKFWRLTLRSDGRKRGSRGRQSRPNRTLKVQRGDLAARSKPASSGRLDRTGPCLRTHRF